MTEIHLFIIWSKGIYQKDRILKDLSDKFTICSVYNVAWTKQMFSNNLSRRQLKNGVTRSRLGIHT